MNEKGRDKERKEVLHDLRNYGGKETDRNDLFLPNKAWGAEDLQRTVVAELGSGRGPPVLHDLRVGFDHFLCLPEMGLGQILLFSWVRLEVIELYKCRVLQLLVVLGFFTKVDDSLLPRIFRPWLRIKGTGASTSGPED